MLLRRLAVGGMAEVYVAKTKGIGGFEKLVAIKVIHPRFSEDEHFVTMLVEEAKISVQLNHVNIAQTFDLGCIDGVYYIAMEYIEGADAFRVEKRARDRKTPIPIDCCCYIAAEVCNGLGYAHRKRDASGATLGIVHRDISPQNVLISYSGEVKVVDFGIAKAALRGGQTEVGVIKGKYYYMSPEQAWGDPVDPRTDIFATGLFLHELLTGYMVYQEDNVASLLDKVRKADIPSLCERRGDVPPALETIVLRALAKEPSDRFQSAHAFGQELTSFLHDMNPTFTGSRLALYMEALFPDEIRRQNSQLIPAPSPSDELELAAMSREEFQPPENSSVYALDMGDHRTRDDVRAPAAPERAPDEETAPLPHVPARETTDRVAAARDIWDEETFLKAEPRKWGDSTMDEDAAAIYGGHDDELAGEKTVATAHVPENLLFSETQSLSFAGGAEMNVERTAPLAYGSEIPAEKTVAVGAGAPRAGGGITAPSKAGMRLGPQAERYFSNPGMPAYSGSLIGQGEPRSADPFIVQAPVHGGQAPRKQPSVLRWIIPIGLGVGAFIAMLIFVIWLASGSDPTSIEVLSAPPGALVTIDGRSVEGVTPVTIPNAEPGRTYRIHLSREGYEPRDVRLRLTEGVNRSVFLLQQLRVNLLVETDPAGAQVWVDNVPRGASPVDVSGLNQGQLVTVRTSAPGHQTIERQVQLIDGQQNQRVLVQLPPGR